MRRDSRSIVSHHPLLIGVLGALLVGGCNCGFSDAAPYVPSYTCTTSSDCVRGTCHANVCTEAGASGYSLVLHLEGSSTALAADQTVFTFDPTVVIQTGVQDIAFPVLHDVEGIVRFGPDFAVDSQLSFRRPVPVAGLVDEVRANAPMAQDIGADGKPIDYRARIPATVEYDVRVLPTTSPTPAAAGIPAMFVGLPQSDVFPPLVTSLDPTGTDTTLRLDLGYDATLFTPCQPLSQTACTVTGRVVANDATGAPVPEAGLSVVVENERGFAISTVALTAADGTFSLRLSDPTTPMRIRLGASESRAAFPDLTLDVGAYDPRTGGDLAIPRFDTIRYEGRVERKDSLVPDAVVRANAIMLFDADGTPVPGARYETNVRTTDSSAPDGAGLFALDLVRGEYDLVASETQATSSLVQAAVLANPPTGTTEQRGQTFVLGPSWHMDGLIVGPDGRSLPYVTVQAIPEKPLLAYGSVEAYARIANVVGDAGGNFDLSADRGVFDLVFSLPASEGLSTFVVPTISVGAAAQLTNVTVAFPPPVALYGSILDADGTPRPGAKVSGFFYRPATNTTREISIPLGEATADGAGHYRLLVPSTTALF